MGMANERAPDGTNRYADPQMWKYDGTGAYFIARFLAWLYDALFVRDADESDDRGCPSTSLGMTRGNGE